VEGKPTPRYAGVYENKNKICRHTKSIPINSILHHCEKKFGLLLRQGRKNTNNFVSSSTLFIFKVASYQEHPVKLLQEGHEARIRPFLWKGSGAKSFMKKGFLT
jgi:hypothetical protein